MRKSFVVAAALWLPVAAWALPTAAQDSAQPWTLERLIAEAKRANPALLAARQEVEAVRGQASQARAWPNPEVELAAEDVPTGGGGLSASKNLVGVTQTLPFPSKTHFASAAGGEAVAAARWDYRAREAELVRDVKATFYRTLAAGHRHAAAKELHELTRSLSDVAGRRARAGAAPEQERLRAEIEMGRAAVEVAAAGHAAAEARQALALLVGRAGDPLEPLVGGLREAIDAAEVARSGERLEARHPEALAAAARRRQAGLESSRAGAERLPDLALGAAYGRDHAAGEDVMEFRISVPLPLFDRSGGRRQEARARAEMAAHDEAATGQRLRERFSVLAARLRTEAEQVEAYRADILPKAEEALRMVRGGYDAGKFGFTDLVDTQRTVAEARLGYWEKVLEMNLTAAGLEALVASAGEE
jgi:cobalt-zinc-cadmium efflux system outer membrane protein